jgi:tripartite-type tricarboxylate transporter receptor subunit TctC
LADKEKAQQINHWEEKMRPFMTILLLSVCLLMPPFAQAQNFPDRPITIVNALAAGTGMGYRCSTLRNAARKVVRPASCC